MQVAVIKFYFILNIYIFAEEGKITGHNEFSFRNKLLEKSNLRNVYNQSISQIV